MMKRLLLLILLSGSAFASRGFNGTTSAINTASNKDGLGGQAAVSMAVWAYPTASVVVNHILGMSNDQFPGFYSAILFIDSSHHAAGYICGSTCATLTSGITPATNAWFHLAITLAGGTATLYYNGSSVATAPITGNAVSVQPTTAGAGYNGGIFGLFFQGRVAEAAVWTVCLSAGEVKSLAHGTPPSLMRVSTSVAGAVTVKGSLYWPLHGFASPEPDLSGTPNILSLVPANGVLFNSPTLENHCPCGMPTGEGH
jgi:hypothetical protein